MKRFLTFIAFLLIVTGSVFAKTYSEYLAEAKSYEAQKKWCYALGSYYDAMGTDGAPESKREAYEGYKKLVEAIESGKPGLGKFDRYTLHVEWMNLLKDAEKYGSTFCIYDFEVSDWVVLEHWLEYDDYDWEFDYATQTAIYSGIDINPLSHYSDRYYRTIHVIENGYYEAYTDEWEVTGWPSKSISSQSNDVYNSDGALIYHDSDDKHEHYKNAFDESDLYEFEFNIVDKNGRELVQKQRMKREGYQNFEIHFLGVTPEVIDSIKAGAAFVNPVACYLKYGDKENLQEMPLSVDKSILYWKNKRTVADNVFLTRRFWTIVGMEMVPIEETPMLMLKTEVTEDLYEAVMRKDDMYRSEGDTHPAVRVSWYDAIYFCNKLSILLGLIPVYSVNGTSDISKWNYKDKGMMLEDAEQISGTITQNESANGFRLPTLNMWFYAASGYEDYKYAGSDDLHEVGWYNANSEGHVHPVAQKKPNEYGLYDMSGNVWEWCWDSSGSRSAIIGGSYENSAAYSLIDKPQINERSNWMNIIGFRLVRIIQ